MAKKNKSGKMILPGAAGAVKNRYCLEHNEQVKPVKVLPQNIMMFECSQGCRLRKDYTILRAAENQPKRF